MECYKGSRALGFSDFIQALAREAGFRDEFMNALRALPFTAFRWETPPLIAERDDRLFECIVHDSPDLDGPADPSEFSAYFKSNADAVSFLNLGGDALLIAPCPQSSSTNYAHLAAFQRSASLQQQHGFWIAVAKAVQGRIGSRPLWLNTAGGGVDWLHVRLDDSPKYYRYAPWRDFSTSEV
ncbi:MAG: hypothetical protein AAGI44_11035 [Pseudomonadota bacterium]